MSTIRGQEEKNKGNSAFKANDFSGAIGHYSAATVADPTNPTYPLNRAAAYLKLEKNEDAERDCNRVLALDPRNIKALFRRGQARVGLQKLVEARDDFRRAMQLDPANSAAKVELGKVEVALKVQSAPRPPLEVPTPPLASTSTSTSSPPPPASKPKRRRVPIKIVDGPTLSRTETPVLTTAEADTSNLMSPVSSRPLNPTYPELLAQVQAPEAIKEALSAARPPAVRGGIFRPNGKHTIFGEHRRIEEAVAATSAANLSPANSTPPITRTFSADGQTALTATPAQVRTPRKDIHGVRQRTSWTLFDFSRQWDKCSTSEDRWSLLKDVSPTALPALFQSSLEAHLLANIVGTLRDVLSAGDIAAQDRVRVREYMIGLTQVKRFSTVVLFLSGAEREAAKEVWSTLGDGESAIAWGFS